MPGQAHPYQITWSPEAERELLLSVILSLNKNNISWDPILEIFCAAGHTRFTRNAIKQRYSKLLRPLTAKLEAASFSIPADEANGRRARRKKTPTEEDPTYVDKPDPQI